MRLAESDGNEFVRYAAIDTISDETLLHRIRNSDAEESFRKAALIKNAQRSARRGSATSSAFATTLPTSTLSSRSCSSISLLPRKSAGKSLRPHPASALTASAAITTPRWMIPRRSARRYGSCMRPCTALWRARCLLRIPLNARSWSGTVTRWSDFLSCMKDEVFAKPDKILGV